ncbi:hypothetical protein AVEN_45816-1 [Araneus ventricosus]|uniref:RNA-directed DNA polymerase n=1 Tax=Araneus ventricosus TaxID=182803 RepID=A0A4Y2FE89_ARAVE|nr:hypothetical protein AVEN_45816-1 [Araneus ventricosus]
MRTGGEKIPLFSATVQHSKSCSVLAKKRTIIPARSECLIQGVPEVPGQFRYAVTNFPSQASQKGVLVAATLVDLEIEAIPVRVLNLNNKPKILDKGDAIATCEPVVGIVARPQEFSGAQHLQSTLDNFQILNEEQRTAVRKLLNEFLNLFWTCYADVGGCNMTQHRINTGDHPLMKQYSRCLPLARKEKAEHIVKEMVYNGIPGMTRNLSWIWMLEPEGQIARWIQRLQEYDFEIQHRKGTSHGNTDALSRRPCRKSCKHCSNAEKKFRIETDTSAKVSTTISVYPWSSCEIQKAHLEDPAIKPILEKKLYSADRPSWQEIAPESPLTKRYCGLWDPLNLKDGVLYRRWESDDGSSCRCQLILPKSRIPGVLREAHDSASGGHFGVMKTLSKTRDRFYWDRLRTDLEK